MRQRRHVNGNSNASASTVDASLAWGSGRTVPANITSTSKRGPSPAAVPDALIESSTATAAVKQERRFGAATARRPQSSSASGHRDPLAGCRPKRRVQSARGVSEKPSQPRETNEIAAPETGIDDVDTTLPKLQSLVVDTTAVNKVKDKVTASHRKPTPPTAIAATGIDATSQVQWAVKVATVTPERDNAEPVEMKDLRRLLRDRYGEKRSVRQAFLTWDTNKDGRLCVDELKDMLTRLGFAEALGGKKVDTILQHVLTMPAASLHYDDFCGFVYGLPELNEPTSSSSYNSSISNGRRTFNTRADEEVMPVSDPDCMVSLLRAKYESRRVHQVFRDWDIDKSGGVTLAEIESNLRRQGLWIAKPQLMKLFDTYDLNHDGRLLYDEFMRLVYGPVHQQRYSYLVAQRRKKQQDQQMNDEDPLNFFRSSAAVPHQATHSTDDPGFRATLQRKLQAFASRLNDAYAAFDDDHNGNLSYRELCHGLQELGLNLTEREFLHLATRVDTDGNGEISFKEFCDVFGGGDASNRRRRSNAAGSEDDVSLDNQQHESKMPLKGGGQRRAAGSFDFSHLTRRTKLPTRCGRTPFTNTKGLISGNPESSAHFTTEAQLYGNGSSSRSAPVSKVMYTLGQEEKQRRDAANASRLQRLRVQMENYEAQAKPLQDNYAIAQERRVRTLQRHQERYHQRIEGRRPRHALSPARKGIQLPRPSSTAPFV